MQKTLLFAFLAAGCAIIANAVKTVTVSKDGKGHFKTISAALASIPNDDKEWEVKINPGLYVEQLIINRTGPLTFRGYTKCTKSEHDECNASYKDNTVTIAWNESTIYGAGDEQTSVVWIGTSNFKAYNINFNQTWADGWYGDGPQAVAVTIDADKVGFYHSGFYGWQDTLFVGNTSYTGRQYFKKCYVSGAVDFIFGNASAFFDDCTIAYVGTRGHTTAQKKQYDTPGAKVKSGFVFDHCKLIAANNTRALQDNTTDLGRPWRDHSTVIYMNSFIDRHIKPQGWGDWYSNTLGDYSHIYYAEYNNYGPGSWGPNAVNRTLNYTRLINETEAKQFKLHNWYDDLSWIDQEA